MTLTSGTKGTMRWFLDHFCSEDKHIANVDYELDVCSGLLSGASMLTTSTKPQGEIHDCTLNNDCRSASYNEKFDVVPTNSTTVTTTIVSSTTLQSVDTGESLETANHAAELNLWGLITGLLVLRWCI